MVGLIGRHARACTHIFDNMLQDRFRVRNNARDDLAAPFDHAENDRLIATDMLTRIAAIDQRFIDFDYAIGRVIAAKRGIAVYLAHVFTDQLAHAPRSLVDNA
jgi:hypothetical protein